MSEKQIARVLEAVSIGCETSRDVAHRTGLSRKRASTYLGQLAECGLIMCVEKTARRSAKPITHGMYPISGGRPMHRYGMIRGV